MPRRRLFHKISRQSRLEENVIAHCLDRQNDNITSHSYLKFSDRHPSHGCCLLVTASSMYKCGVCCLKVPVRLSVTIRYCVETAQSIVKILSKFFHHLTAQHSNFRKLIGVMIFRRDHP